MYPTFLFVPGNKPDLFPKALRSGAEVAILDLEDAVGLADKKMARELVLTFLQEPIDIHQHTRLALRSNSLSSPWGKIDLKEMKAKGIEPEWYIHPKTESAEQVKELDTYFGENTKIILMIESMRGFYDLREIASASKKVVGLALGGADFTYETGLANNWDSLYFYRSMLVMHAKANGLFAIDSPYFDFKDTEGLKTEMQQLKNMGFEGRLVIHPSQIRIIQAVMRPTEAEVDEAEAIIATFEAAAGNVCQWQGKMIDEPIYQKALRTAGHV